MKVASIQNGDTNWDIDAGLAKEYDFLSLCLILRGRSGGPNHSGRITFIGGGHLSALARQLTS